MIGPAIQFVLHAHLPFVRHPENAWHLEENWLFEALTETYLPLLEVFANLDRDNVPGAFTVSVSQPLAAMLDDELLRDRFSARLRSLRELAEREIEFLADDVEMAALARWYRDRFIAQLALYENQLGRDVLGAFGALHKRGRIELATCVGTHGSLPLMRYDESRQAQIFAAAEQFETRMGFAAAGMWLGECANWWNTPEQLARAGVRWTVVDAHAIENASATPARGIYAPLISDRGVAFFGRDPQSSRQVWSATEGYPGDFAYREFYRDAGFDRPTDYIAPYIHPDGIRLDTGLKYHRITGRDVREKLAWNPRVAMQRAREHARHFVAARCEQLRGAGSVLDTSPIITAPYDAELYGHWWFEGPMFLDAVARAAAERSEFSLTTPSRTLGRSVPWQVANPSPSSWGENGYWSVWLNRENAWMYRDLHATEGELRKLAARSDAPGTPEHNAVAQAARELLLAQSSDWAFIVKTATAVQYAEQRTREHVANVFAISEALNTGDTAALAALTQRLQERTPIFPRLDPSWWAPPA